MKKRMLSLLCALALCLGLLPVTALADGTAPQMLYVGGQFLNNAENSFWTTDLSTGDLTKYEGNEDSWNVKYEPSSATLTLNNAKIVNNNDVSSIPYGAGIYALCSNNQSVSLTIVLIGENTIVGDYGILVEAQQGETNGVDASLIIKSNSGSGSSSLNVTGSSNHGISVRSGSGNASLTIENTTVNASTSGGYVAGVCVQSSSIASGSPEISLTVKGGSLTANGGTSSDGILFYVGSSSATNPTTKLTVGGNAIVDAKTGGISAFNGNADDISDQIKVSSSGDDNNGGIVFDGTEGTVYGKVELQDELEIKSGETLTIPKDASLNCNEKLTNNGTILVSGGNLTGTLSDGTTPTTPTITTDPTDKTVTEGETATFSVAASNAQTYQWQQSTDSGSSWADISGAASETYTTAATTTAMNGNQYRCVVKSASGVSVISSAATLTVNPYIPPTPTYYTISASADPAEGGAVSGGGSYQEGGTVTLTATANSGWRFVGWVDESGQTVSTSASYIFAAEKNGTFTAQFEKLYTVTVSASEGGTATGGGSYAEGDTVTLTATPDSGWRFAGWVDESGQTVSTSASYTFTAETDGTFTAQFEKLYTVTVSGLPTLGGTVSAGGSYAAGDTVPLTATANPGYRFVGWTSSQGGVFADVSSANTTFTMPAGDVTVIAWFTELSSGSGTTTKTPSQQATDKIQSAKDGAAVEITLKSGQTKLDKEVFEALAGRDVTLEITVPGGVTWTVNGLDIPENAKLSDLDLGVTLDASTIPASVINAITGAVDTIQLSLKHDGEFGFTMTLIAPLGKENKGLWANLYYYNERTRELEFQAADRIASDGTASFPFGHASDYAIVIDTDSHEPVEIPFTDVPGDAWYADAAGYVYKHGLMAGTSAATFGPDVTTSRAMIATILWRMAGSPVVNYALTFDDVPQGQWYSEAIRWAASEGVVSGYGDSFGTNDPITREQFAVMLWQFAKKQGYDVSVGESTNLLSYADVASLSDWAIPAMQWACGAGIITGTGDGSTLTPQGQATRAQAAVMLMQFCRNYVTW